MHIIHFFFNDTATTEIYTLSLHDALPISRTGPYQGAPDDGHRLCGSAKDQAFPGSRHRKRLVRSEEHTSELQSPDHLVYRLLLDKKIYHGAAQMRYDLISHELCRL